MIYALIQANQARFPIARQCQVLQVSKSGYYDWQERPPSARALANQALLAHIQVIYHASDATYGMPRVQQQLRHEGVAANRKRIAALMRQAGLRGVSRRRGWVKTTGRNPERRPAPDLVKRQFVATGLNQLWVADMTYSAPSQRSPPAWG
jgi:putative transposase